ncbi:MAG: efflux RND transporter periplasmic adaptor subunit [Acidobacteriota bacterium]
MSDDSSKKERLRELRIDRADIETAGSGGRGALVALTLVLLAVAAAAWWWLSQNRAAEVEVASVTPFGGTTTRSAAVLDASGYVTARRRATVSAKFTGKIVEVDIEEGMRVTEGQVLARLDDSLQRKSLALAEAQLAATRGTVAETEVRLKQAQLDRKRATRLVEQDVTSQAELDDAEAEVEALEARLALAREQILVAERTADLRRQELDDTIIRAPFAGVVVTKNAQPGEMISPVSAGGGFTRTGIGTLVDMGSLEIEVDVSESYIQRVRSGQGVSATLDAYPDWRIPARVITPVPTADRQKATVRVRIAFEEMDPRILPDMGVKVSFLEEAGDDADAAEPPPTFAIPAEALRQDGDRDVVFVVRGEVVERRAVKVVDRQGGQAILTSGVSAGDRVVVEGPETLADGDPVRVAPES